MQTAFVVVGSILNVAALIPYIRDIVRGKTKPRLVSWFTWALLNGVTAAAALSDGQYPAAALMGISATGCVAILVLGWRHGSRHIGPMDVFCQSGALVGMVLWFMFDSPALAIIIATVIDLIGALPTIVHAWVRPHEETWSAYLLYGVAGLLTLFAAESWQITAALAPTYFFVFNTALACIIVLRHAYSVQGMPPTLHTG